MPVTLIAVDILLKFIYVYKRHNLRKNEAHQLGIHFFRGNIVRYGFLGTADLNFNLAQSNAGGNGNALKPGFFR